MPTVPATVLPHTRSVVAPNMAENRLAVSATVAPYSRMFSHRIFLYKTVPLEGVEDGVPLALVYAYTFADLRQIDLPGWTLCEKDKYILNA